MPTKVILLEMKNWVRIFFLPCEENNYRAKIFTGKFLVCFFLAAVVLKLGFAFFLSAFSASRFYADITRTSLVELANAERAKSSLPPLAENPLLDSAAYMKAMDMAKNGYFSHNSPSGVNPWYWFDRSGYDYKYAGENLAIGFIESNEVNDAWIASPTHKANIVNGKYRDIGIAVLKTNFQGNPVTLVVQLFGSKQSKLALPKVPLIPRNGGEGGESQDLAVNGQDNEVLGAATAAAADKNSAIFKLIKWFAEKYFNLVQWLVYGSMVLIIFLLLANFALKADMKHADLVVKALGFVVIMGIFAAFDQNLIVALLPHKMTI